MAVLMTVRCKTMSGASNTRLTMATWSDCLYVPALRVVIRYDRLIGYFSAAAQTLPARGIEGLLVNAGHMCEAAGSGGPRYRSGFAAATARFTDGGWHSGASPSPAHR